MTEIATKVTVCTGGCDPKCGECGIQKIVPLSAEEIAQREADAVAYAAQQAEAEATQAQAEATRASALAKLAALGLTEAEAASIIK